MATYVIGDLHGCLKPLQKLLDKLQYDPANDTLWFVGDLVNRGPHSLKTLRFVKELGENAISVLGNHDLHCLAYLNQIGKRSGEKSLEDIANASDRDELEYWLRHRPMLHHDTETNTIMVHAGIPPVWSLSTAKKQAKKLQKILRSNNYKDFLAVMYGNPPEHWRDADTPQRRRRYTVNALTRMRYCWSDGSLDFSFNGQPLHRPTGLSAWHSTPGRVKIEQQIIFGHWSAHPAVASHNIMPIDRGCVYGGSLVAYLLEEKRCVWVNA